MVRAEYLMRYNNSINRIKNRNDIIKFANTTLNILEYFVCLQLRNLYKQPFIVDFQTTINKEGHDCIHISFSRIRV
jgi:hypothetical protein